MSANVRSFEAIQRVRDELVRFTQRSNDGLDELAGEIRRVIDWVEHDRPAYWKLRVRKAYDAVGEAKGDLHRCLMYPVNDETPSCAEEKAALKKAQAHLLYCQEKQKRVREWAIKLRHELHEYGGRMGKLKTLVEADAPRTIALMERQTEALERYLSAVPSARMPKVEADESPTEPRADASDADAAGSDPEATA